MFCLRTRRSIGLPLEPKESTPINVRLTGNEEVSTEVLIDATGNTQWTSRLLKIRGSKFFMHCFGEYIEDCKKFEGDPTLRFLRPDYRYGNGGGWFYSMQPANVSFGYAFVVPTTEIDKAKLTQAYFRAKDEFEPYNRWMSGARSARQEIGIIPLGRIGRFYTDRILIVGDAAGQAHPWVGEGCRPALRNGKLCAETVLKAFSQNRFDRHSLAQYEKNWNKENRERFWRSESAAEVIWNWPDSKWDKMISHAMKAKPEQVLKGLRDGHATIFQKAYAVAGYLRRGAVKWLSGK